MPRYHIVTQVVTQVNIACRPDADLYAAAQRKAELLKGWEHEKANILACGIFECDDAGKPIRQVPAPEVNAAVQAGIAREEAAAKAKADAREAFVAAGGKEADFKWEPPT